MWAEHCSCTYSFSRTAAAPTHIPGRPHACGRSTAPAPTVFPERPPPRCTFRGGHTLTAAQGAPAAPRRLRPTRHSQCGRTPAPHLISPTSRTQSGGHPRRSRMQHGALSGPLGRMALCAVGEGSVHIAVYIMGHYNGHSLALHLLPVGGICNEHALVEGCSDRWLRQCRHPASAVRLPPSSSWLCALKCTAAFGVMSHVCLTMYNTLHHSVAG